MATPVLPAGFGPGRALSLLETLAPLMTHEPRVQLQHVPAAVQHLPAEIPNLPAEMCAVDLQRALQMQAALNTTLTTLNAGRPIGGAFWQPFMHYLLMSREERLSQPQ